MTSESSDVRKPAALIVLLLLFQSEDAAKATMMLCLFILDTNKTQQCTYIYIYSIYKAVYFVTLVFFGGEGLSFIVTISLCFYFSVFFMFVFVAKKKKKKQTGGPFCNFNLLLPQWRRSLDASEHTLPHGGKRTFQM